jgi:hypothetical protein
MWGQPPSAVLRPALSDWYAETYCTACQFDLVDQITPVLVQPFPQRSTVSEDAGALRISIPPKRSFVILFFVGWLSFWTYAGIQTGRKLLTHFELFSAFWMLGWALGELWASYAILYSLAGREIIVATPETLSQKTTIFGIGLTHAYLVREMRDLRYQAEVGAGRSRRASRIVFDYGAKTVGFAQDVEEAEAAELVTRIKQHCNIVITPAPQESGIKFWQQQ